MLFAVFFAFWRFLEIVTLIPTMGMLAYFVNGWVSLNQLTPDYVLVLFIVSVLALAWAAYTLFSCRRSSASSGAFVAVADLLFVGAFIGGAYALRFVAAAGDCARVAPGSYADLQFGPFGSARVATWADVRVDRTCAMLKACFALGIVNAVLFFCTSVLACFHGDRVGSKDRAAYYRETHYHRHGHRSAPHSRRSSHSHRRSYV